ncbi:DeoR/GlpR family DNA-binding transcription regulator [Pedobacter punctiformis]|uniref:DeoR/GlpR family DNA-binding transcription regulator n=1 Tax=Pedobacter punctiformis TaxID=3004097 RepID=A0ABT4L568_9SPHI|nr:DeoR/GlpR family DNA-binding transcription regulator [Pedobacter sp. HCMS5-2]MCZ4243050.1 DeoR/GlpR family DNA-binding transcription regulator [Pedobacter sp. HCMS5-2]
MLKKERHDFIMRQINLHNRVLTSDLVQLLNVSEDTIRRDLQELVDQGRLFKVHGGALSKSYHSSFDDSTVYARDSKIIIAKKATKLIKDGMVVLTGGGTTILEFVKQLPESLQATFFTISPLVAVELAKYNNVEVILIGGLFSKNSQITYGGHVIMQLSEIKADLCLMGTSAIDAIEGLTDTDWEINQLKKAMLAASKKSAVLCISEKLDIALRLKVCPIEHINYLVTELDKGDQLLKSYSLKELQIL